MMLTRKTWRTTSWNSRCWSLFSAFGGVKIGRFKSSTQARAPRKQQNEMDSYFSCFLTICCRQSVLLPRVETGNKQGHVFPAIWKAAENWSSSRNKWKGALRMERGVSHPCNLLWNLARIIRFLYHRGVPCDVQENRKDIEVLLQDDDVLSVAGGPFSAWCLKFIKWVASCTVVRLHLLSTLLKVAVQFDPAVSALLETLPIILLSSE